MLREYRPALTEGASPVDHAAAGWKNDRRKHKINLHQSAENYWNLIQSE